MITLLELIKKMNEDPAVGLIDETAKVHPELMLSDARTIPGVKFETRVRVALGRTTGSFRSGNEGIDPITHRYENRQTQCYIVEPRIECDVAEAKAWPDGPEVYVSEQTEGALEGEMQGLSTCFYYGRGTKGNSKAFPGLMDCYDTTNMVVDAGGTTANTGSSVWLVMWGPKAVRWVLGMNGKFEFNPIRIESLLDANSKKFDGYVRTMNGRVGLFVGSQQAIVRVKKLTADAGKGLTDALLNAAIAKFPSGWFPTAVYSSRRSATQLQNSRTATSPTGTPAPMPTSIQGTMLDPASKAPVQVQVPFLVTDAITDNEPLTL